MEKLSPTMIINLLDYVSEGVMEALSNCNKSELLTMNVGSFAIYTAISGELKSRIAEEANISHNINARKQYTDSVIYRRVGFIESEG